MSKYRVYELAKEFNKETKEVIDVLRKNNFTAKNNFSSVGDEERNALKKYFEKGAAPVLEKKTQPAKANVEKNNKPKEHKENNEAKAKKEASSNNGSKEKKNNAQHADHNKPAQHKNNHQHDNGNRKANNAEQSSRSNRSERSEHNDRNERNERRNNDRRNNNRSERNNNRGERNGRNDKNNRGDRNNRKGRNNKRNVQPAPKVEIAHPKHIKLPESIAVKDLASKMSYTAAEVVKKLFMMGVMATINQEIDFDTAALVAAEFGVTCEELPPDVDPTEIPEIEDDPKSLKLRPPVVTVMGHVDHGKTSLLDCIRNTHVSAHEAGGITQHIGAYQVNCKGKKIVFLDTPGHEAFTAMRARGAQITDIAILVVAADDGVMPQTVEAINHAKAAGIEIIVAINKIDKESANIDRVKQELMEYELVPEDWGGSTIFCPVSAHTKEGIDNLLEMIILTAEILELKANKKRKARGIVIEAQLDKGRGSVATVLVQKGTLHVGDCIAVGDVHGKVRAMFDDKHRRVKEAYPSMPVEILGLNGVPQSGEIFMATENEKEARQISEAFITRGKEKLIADTKSRMSLDDLYNKIQEGNVKDLNLIIKADVQGSVEAVKSSLLKLSNEEVAVKCIHSGVGAINESDVILASASNAIIIGFNIRPDNQAKDVADREKVDIRLYRVIYNAIEDIESAMKGMLDPIYEEKVIGHAEVRQTYKASGVGTIAGSYVLDGILKRNCTVRITREGEQIFEGNLASLKRFKDDVKEVKSGFECGLVMENFNDIKEGDLIEAYVMEEVPR